MSQLLAFASGVCLCLGILLAWTVRDMSGDARELGFSFAALFAICGIICAFGSWGLA